MGGELDPHSPAIVQTTLSSAKSCLALNYVDCFFAYGM
jgi:hypothetical protein